MNLPSVCVYCGGEKCPACRHTGFELPENDQQAAIDEFNESKLPPPPTERLEAAHEAWKLRRFS